MKMSSKSLLDNIQKINEFEKVMRPIPKSYSRIQSIIEVQKLKVVDALIGFQETMVRLIITTTLKLQNSCLLSQFLERVFL